MEDSAFEGLMISVYVFIFVIASSLTIYLFNSTVEFADKAFEYGKVTTGDSVVETSSAPNFNVITGAELLTYYYNYTDPDKYGDDVTVSPNYIFLNSDGTALRDIDIKQSYTLIYKTANTGQKPIIEVKKVASELEEDTSPPIVVDKKPTDPVIETNPYTVDGQNIMPKTKVEFIAESTVTHSFLTNNIKEYRWKIDYSPEDGRADYTFTTPGLIGELTIVKTSLNALEFRKGRNVIYVTAVDILGNSSNTVSKIIDVGYKNPIVNSITELNNKVANGGYVDIDSSAGANLTFIANAVSQNTGGYIKKYDWYVNNTLVQSGANNKLPKSFVPGNYTIRVVVTDSIEGKAERSFSFAVNKIPAPTITSNNATLNSNRTLTIDSDTFNLLFTATHASKFSINKYVWNVNGAKYETSASSPLNRNFNLGSNTVTVYGVTAGGVTSLSNTYTFTLKPSFTSKDFGYTGGVQQFTITASGTYNLETWGAQGGLGYASWPNANTNSASGKGGYASGRMYLAKGTIIYVVVGGQGREVYGGYNGGGNGLRVNSSWGMYQFSGGGGGATDIRINGNAIQNRVIVAGGGGGASPYDNTYQSAAATSSWYYTASAGTSGSGRYSQINNGGLARTDSGYYHGYSGNNGTIGQGGNGADNPRNLGSYGGSQWIFATAGGGGGGGYYGGGGGNGGSINYTYTAAIAGSGGGGGSSYTYSLTYTTISSGVDYMKAPAGGSSYGNIGNGYARITYVP